MLRSSRKAANLVTTSSEWRKIACMILGMAAYALLLEPIGFALCTLVLMVFYLKVIALRRWPLSLGFACAVAVLSHLFFDKLLNAQLPRGMLAALL